MEAFLLPLLPLAAVLLFGRALDIVLLFGFGIFKNWDTAQEFSKSYLNHTIVNDSAKAATALFALLQITRYILGLKLPCTPSNGFPVQPLLFPCRTSHVRMFPTKHGFSYSYLLTGVPVGWNGSVGGMLSAYDGKEPAPWYSRVFSLNPGGAWYTVSGDDYLDRGHVEGGLQGKLKKYLEGQGIDPEKFSYVYLLTAARFLGYASNPLSVWYLYTATKELRAIILEVNNTFDERRIYFLEPNLQDRNSDGLSKPTRYTGTWTKDFYVSVFNSRAGSYSLAAYDPFFPHMTGTGPIKMTVTLNSPEGHAKLIARICSAGEALDPASMSVWQKTRFLGSWWWVGLATFPRTVKEALVILFQRKLPWVFRPEPRKETIARHANATELCIESLFHAYLRDLVENSEENFRIRYIPAGLLDISEEVIVSSSVQLAQGGVDELEIRVLTPIFYSRVVQYPDLLDGILSECHESSTISLSSTELLSKLEFEKQGPSPNDFWDTLSFKIIYALRRRPTPIICLYEPKDPLQNDPIPNKKADVRLSKSTGLDNFVLSHSSPSKRKEYARQVLKLLFTEHIAFGWVEILDLEILVARSLALWIIAQRVF